MNKEITISIEEYKDLIRCKTLLDANKPTGILYNTDSDRLQEYQRLGKW